MENSDENDRTSEEEQDEWEQEFDFDSEEDTALLDEALEESEEEQDKNIKIAIVGRPNVGKSTLTNRILGEDRVVVYDIARHDTR